MKKFFVVALCLLWSASGYAQQQEPPKQEQEDSRFRNMTEEQKAEVRRGIPMGGMNGKNRHQIYYERIVKGILGEEEAKPKLIQNYIDYFKMKTLSDENSFAFYVTGEVKEGKVYLDGKVEFENLHEPFITFIKALNLGEVVDRIEILPSKNLDGKLIGLVKDYSVFLRKEPIEKSEPMTQGILGDTLFLLAKEENGWFLCHSSAGYIAYCPSNALIPMTTEEYMEYSAKPKVEFKTEYSPQVGPLIPHTAKLLLMGETKTGYKISIPGGEVIEVPKGYAQPIKPNALIEPIIATGFEMLDRPYTWGGKVKMGTDCSGFVQTSFKTHGIALPRDAYQQMLVGELVGTRSCMEGIQRGDTLFFLGRSGKISHVALYLGDGEFINASGSKVQLGSFNPESPYFQEKYLNIFCFAKRILVN